MGVGAVGVRVDVTVETFLFTDVEGSTRTWQARPDATNEDLARHDTILREAIHSNGGRLVKGTGDGVLAAFETPRACVAAAVSAQRQLLAEVPFRVRMSIATGEAHERDGDWFGPAVNRCARLLEAAHGGQITASASTAALVAELPVDGVSFLDLGTHRLRDLPDPQAVFQVVAEGLLERHPPLRTTSTPPNNLPSSRTSLIGREPELQELEGLVSRVRLLTITGVGGVGKTRLAVELAARSIGGFPGGVFFTELSGVTDGGAVARTVADAAGLHGGGGSEVASAYEQLGSFFTGAPALLVLDNCEHLLDDCARLVDHLLDQPTSVTVLATTREPLAVEGEHVWRVPSLPVDGVRSPAVDLFLERAAAVQRRGGAADAEVIAGICRRLDGIPLAIELAAAQVAHLPVDEIAARLNERFALLTGGRRRVQRQQTLLAAVEWSHELLAEEETIVLRRLAVFAGWFSLVAVESVCAQGLSSSTLLLIGSLVRKSMLVADPAAPRYRLLETIRLFAEERLVRSGEAQAVRIRHRDWVFEHTESDPDYTFDAAEAVVEVADDFRTALEWSIARGDRSVAASATRQGTGYWSIVGRSDEGVAFLDALDPSQLEPSLRATHHMQLAVLLLPTGERERTEQEVAAIRRCDPDPSSAASLQGDIVQATLLMQTDPLGAVALLDGVIARAGDETAFFARSARDTRAHVTLAFDPPAAIREWEDLFGGNDSALRRWDDFFIIYNLGGASHLTGDHGRALAMADELDRRGFSTGRSFVTYAATLLRVLGHAGLGLGAAAREAARQMTREVVRSATPRGMTDCALACAAILVAEGDLRGAAAMLGAARGAYPQLRPATLISAGIHREYTAVERRGLPEEEGRAIYQRARAADVRGMVEAELGLR